MRRNSLSRPLFLEILTACETAPICWPLSPPQLISKVESLGNCKGGCLSLKKGHCKMWFRFSESHHLSFVGEEGMAGRAISFAAEYGKDSVVGRIRRAVGDAGDNDK